MATGPGGKLDILNDSCGSTRAVRALAGAAMAGLLALAGCQGGPAELVLSGPTMGSTYTVRIAGGAGAEAELRPLVESVLAEVDAALSSYRPDSELARFNASDSGEWFPVSALLADTVARSLRLGELTGGAFDITLAPVVQLWGFGPAAPLAQPPDDDLVSAQRQYTGLGRLQLRQAPPALRKQLPELRLDLDGIAPGEAVDLIATRLDAAGFHDYMIEVGGEVRAQGRNASGTPWRIGIERPDERGRTVGRVLQVDGMAMSTSGDYRDYFEAGGKRYGHTIDPATGRPVTHALASVTVLQPLAAEADALATALTVLGAEAGWDLAETRGWPALFIERTPDGYRQRETTAFARYVAAGVPQR